MNSDFNGSRRLSVVAWCRLVAAFVCALVAFRAFGLNPHHRLTQYSHTVWRTQDGVFSGTPNTVSQTNDGYIWVGTVAGLMRFDGVRFTAFQPSAKESLLSPVINSLLAAQDGSLWIGTASYLAHFKDGDLTNYLDVHGKVNNLQQDRNGVVWFSRTRSGDDGGGVCRVADSKIHCFGKSEGVPVRLASCLVEGDIGSWWICGGTKVIHWNGSSSRDYPVAGLNTVKDLVGITSLVKDSDGSLWVGVDWQGKGLGLQHLVDGKLVPFIVPGIDSSSFEVVSLFFDRDHSLWIGTDRAGVYRINGTTVDRFRAADGLSSDDVNGFFQDREGNIWVTTSKGLDKFRETNVISYSKAEGFPFDRVESALAARDGTVWAGDVELTSISDKAINSFDQKTGLPGRLVTSLLEDQQGKLWVGIDDKLFVRDQSGFQEIRRVDGHSVGVVEKLAKGRDGSVWVRPAIPPFNKLIHFVNYKAAEEVQLPDGLRSYAFALEANGNLLVSLQSGDLAQYQAGDWKLISLHRPKGTGTVSQFAYDPGGGVLGATTSGVLGWKDGRAQDLNTDNGLPCSRVYSLVFDSEKTLWLYTACGLLKITNSELERWWKNPKVKVKLRSFGILDGAEPAPPDFQPQASVSPDGKLWFVNGTVLQQIDPLHLYRNTVVPPVHIEEIIADKKEYSTQKDLSLPALTRELQINYTALSFVIPQRVRFRYKLEGWENDWQDAGTRRQAFYTNLRPATYRFHVIACNDDGLWNDVGDVLSFNIAPAYYQTRWFQILCAILFAGMLWILYLFRLKQATSHIQQRLGARMEERERIARELHDTLLQGFHGLMLRFQAIMKVLPSEGPAREMMGSVLDRADEVLLEGRESVRDLREGGMFAGELSEMMAAAGDELAQGTPIVFSSVVVGDPRALNPIAFKEIYRIAREALSNAFQHSQGMKIELELTYSSAGCSVRIRDDGSGIDNVTLGAGKKGHWGLSGMRERAQNLGAQLNIWSKAGAGTEIELTVPSLVAYPLGQRSSVWQRIKRPTKKTEV